MCVCVCERERERHCLHEIRRESDREGGLFERDGGSGSERHIERDKERE